MNSQIKQVVEKYSDQSIYYLENAFRALESAESEKASEFLWGSIAEALKAVAAIKGIQLKSHRDLWDYARGLTKELRDKSIFDAFRHANSLHSNFYESKLRLEDVYISVDEVRTAVNKLLKLISGRQSS